MRKIKNILRGYIRDRIYLRSIMRKSIQRTTVKNVISIERSLRIFRITFAHSKRLLTAFWIRSETTNCMSTNLKQKWNCCNSKVIPLFFTFNITYTYIRLFFVDSKTEIFTKITDSQINLKDFPGHRIGTRSFGNTKFSFLGKSEQVFFFYDHIV